MLGAPAREAFDEPLVAEMNGGDRHQSQPERPHREALRLGACALLLREGSCDGFEGKRGRHGDSGNVSRSVPAADRMNDCPNLSLAVCIPTHDGRRDPLAQALDAVAAQIDDDLRGRVSIVVSDNASDDGTAEMVGSRREAGVPVTYARNERDLGAAANIDRVVELAEADFCWLLSSDDVPSPGGLARVLELLASQPDVPGLTVNQAVLDAAMCHAHWEQPTFVVPPAPDVVSMRGIDAIVGELGWIMSGLSSQVVRRNAWLEAARCDPEPAALFPHTGRMLAMARRDPRWLWTPEKLVCVRASNPVLPVSHARWETWLLDELDGHWRAAAGAWSPGHRAVGETYLRAAEWRMLPGPARDRLALLRRVVLRFWRMPRLWRRTLPRLAWAVPARPRPRERMDPLHAGADAVQLRAAPPTAMPAADMVRLPCLVRNGGPVTLRSAPPASVHLASRWRRPGGDWRVGARASLPWALRPGASAKVVVPIVAPWEPGTWELEVSAAQDGVGWLPAGSLTTVSVSRGGVIAHS